MFFGTRTRGAEEVKKSATQQNDDSRLGKRGRIDILQSDAEVWKLGRDVDHSQHHRMLQEISPPASYLTCRRKEVM